jgi:adenylate kinase family enzyme
MKIKNPFIFLFGRPGCGKSAVYKILTDLFKKEKVAEEFERIDDFPILKELLDEDKEFKRHIRKDGGFAVTDWSIVDEVLQVINKKAFEKVKENKIVFIEFARDNYLNALKNFDKNFLENSVGLYIKCDFEICLERNEKRFKELGGKDIDAHIVPPDLMKSYYKKDDIEDILNSEGIEYLKRIFPVKVYVVENNYDCLDKLEKELIKFVKFYCENIK